MTKKKYIFSEIKIKKSQNLKQKQKKADNL